MNEKTKKAGIDKLKNIKFLNTYSQIEKRYRPKHLRWIIGINLIVGALIILLGVYLVFNFQNILIEISQKCSETNETIQINYGTVDCYAWNTGKYKTLTYNIHLLFVFLSLICSFIILYGLWQMTESM